MFSIVWDYKKFTNNKMNFNDRDEANTYWQLLKKAGATNMRPIISEPVVYVQFADGGKWYGYKKVCPIQPVKDQNSILDSESKHRVLTKNGVRYAHAIKEKEITQAEMANLEYPYDKWEEFINIKYWRSNLDYTVELYQFEKNGLYAAHVESCWDHLQNEFGDIIPEKMITTPYFKTWNEAIDCALKMMEEEEIYVI